jgi:opacity protein-like surface antigen
MPRVQCPAAAFLPILCVILFVPFGVSRARADSDTGGSPPTGVASSDARGPGAGLQFLIGSDFTLSSFDGALISYRTRGSNGRGWRFGVGLGGSILNLDTHVEDPDSSFKIEQDSKDFTISLVGQRLFSTAARRDINFYWGIGPDLDYSTSRNSVSSQDLSNSMWSWRAGIAGAAGVEWLLADRITLLAEYGALASYSWGKQKQTNTSDPASTATMDFSRFAVSSSQVRFGLTAWFR